MELVHILDEKIRKGKRIIFVEMVGLVWPSAYQENERGNNSMLLAIGSEGLQVVFLRAWGQIVLYDLKRVFLPINFISVKFINNL